MERDPRDVFEILVREHADMLTVYLRALVRDPASVDDLFQETVMTAWRRLDDFDRSRPFGPWLRGIAHKLVLAHGRKRRREVPVGNEAVLARVDAQLSMISERPGDAFDDKVAALHECIENLSPMYREAIEMRYLKETASVHAAQHMDVSGEAFKKRLQRARAQLLECLTKKSVIAGTA